MTTSIYMPGMIRQPKLFLLKAKPGSVWEGVGIFCVMANFLVNAKCVYESRILCARIRILSGNNVC